MFTNVPNPRAKYPKDGEYLPTLVRYGATIGANATIVCGVTIGRHAFIGAGSVVTTDVPDYALAYGVPAKLRGWVCECGTQLAFEGEDGLCAGCQREFIFEPRLGVREKGTTSSRR
ncbi:MAG: acyltransferase [Dehalococcoidia bacterium]